MIDHQELVFVVDEHNQPTRPQLRRIAHKNGLWHRTSGIWVINRKKQILCQKRSMKKDVNPGFWEAFFGGHLAPNEDYLENAAVEVGEELGITVEKNNLMPFMTLKSDKPTHKEFQRIFALILEGRDKDFHVEKEEVDQLRWIGIDEVRNILLDRKEKNWVHKPWDRQVLTWLATL